MREMRSMYRQSRHSMPQLNMASMPDLIFTVLFFFMIVTHMRSDDVKVRYDVPEGQAVEQMQQKAGVVNIYIGRGLSGQTEIQLNGEIVQPDAIVGEIEAIRRQMSPEQQEKLTVNLRADRKTPMGIISDVKQALQKSYALRINYAGRDSGN